MHTRIALGAVALSLTLAACGSKTVGTSSNSNPTQNNPSDTSVPTVSITSPSSSGSYSTASAAVALSGTAADNVGVASVTWRNVATGASANASGTGSWTVANIALVSGVNTITVTARDAAGNASTATIAVTYNAAATSSLSGNVDSSLIDRSAANTVYLYNGTVTPGSVAPVATTPVTQDNGACTFSYRFGTMPAGAYTVAFSSDGATFRGTATVTLAASGTTDHPFPPNRRLQVGLTRTLKTPGAAQAVALNGDVIEIDAGEYVDDNVTWGQNNLTLRGVGGRPHMRSTSTLVNPVNPIPNGKGIWVQPPGKVNMTVENIEFSGAKVVDLNGVGIRADGDGLVVCNAYVHDNQGGILGGQGDVLIEYSEFDRNGNCDDQSGCAHNMYINSAGGGGTVFTLRYSYIHRAHTGHNVKTRAPENHILYNRIMDEADGDGSYSIDLPNAGLTFVIGNLLQKGPLNDAQPAFISYGVEPGIDPNHELYVVNNTFVNDDTRSAEAFSIGAFTPTIRVVNNLFVGLNAPTGAGITSTTNLVSSNPGLADRTNFDYHLTSTSPARNAGTNPGSAGAESLVPVSQYVHPANREGRPVDVTIDIGAYEFQ
jgi:hypothetical protein